MSGTALMTAVVAVTVAFRGGFSSAGRSAFVVGAGVALALAAVRDEGGVWRALAAPPIALLGVLGGLAALSAAWTIGEPVEAIEAGLVVLAAAALAAAAAVLCRDTEGARRAMAGLAVVAGISALAGLVGVVLREQPLAERIDGSWRPGGPFEYPPALALLQVSVLPALLTGMVGRQRRLSFAAAGGACAAAAVVALSGSRLQTFLALALLAVAVAWSPSLLGVSHLRAFAAAGLLLATGVAAEIALGGYSPPGVTRGASGRGLELAAIMGTGLVAWWLWSRTVGQRDSRAGRERPRRAPPVAVSPAKVVALLAVSLASMATVVLADGSTGDRSYSVAHGRIALWSDAVDAARARPFAGAGSETFLVATQANQDAPATRFAHSLPLESAAELGLLGAALVLALYVACATGVAGCRDVELLWLLGPAVLAFLMANLFDWEWHFAGSVAVFAICLGPLLAWRLRATSRR